jgi:hypothetical protein
MSDTKGRTPGTGDGAKFTWHPEDVEVIQPDDPRHSSHWEQDDDDTTDGSTKP